MKNLKLGTGKRFTNLTQKLKKRGANSEKKMKDELSMSMKKMMMKANEMMMKANEMMMKQSKKRKKNK